MSHPSAALQILVINPNTTDSMTDALRPLVEHLGFTHTAYTYFTGRAGPSSINNEHDEEESTRANWPYIEPLLAHYDGFVVACYSQHGLVPLIRAHAPGGKPVTGIFEASVTASLHLLQPDEQFGIVSTGKVWERLLTEAVQNLLGADASKRFAGVETTGLNATELHEVPPEVVRRKMKEATKRLVGKGKVAAICLGCAGMAGMDEMVREACVEELGKEQGEKVRIVDGVKAAVGILESLIHCKF